MLKVATLFSGIGTPEQSLKHLGIEHETVFACEIDKYARTTYLTNNEEPLTFYEDVYNIDGNKYKNQIDILIGGSPCQSFSIAGKRMGTSCPRGNLIYEYFRIVEEAQPKVFIYENVKGFLSIDKGETFKNFVESFKDLGYTVYHKVLNTKDHLIPQNRERIYIVGFKDNVDFHFQEKQELKLRLKDMLEDFVDEKYHLSKEAISYMDRERQGKPRWEFHKNEVDGIAACLTANMHKGVPYGVITPHLPIRLKQTHTLNIKGNDSIKRIYSSDGLCPSLTTMQGGHREPKVAINVVGQYNKPFQKRVNKTPVEINQFLKDNKNNLSLKEIAEKTNIPKTQIEHYFRIDKSRAIPSKEDWNKLKEISNCLSGVQKDSYITINDEVKYIFRKLTPRECFRLQGFDDSFIFPRKMSDTQLYKQAGNGMSRNILDMIFTQIFTCYAKHIENIKE